MADQLKDVTLVTLKAGAAVERFDHCLAEVLDNVADLNTEAEAVRKIVLEVTVKPSRDRDSFAYGIKAKSVLAPPKALAGTAFVGRRGDKVVAVGFDPRQADMFDPQAGADIVLISDRQAQGGAKE